MMQVLGGLLRRPILDTLIQFRSDQLIGGCGLRLKIDRDVAG